jgi:tRNA-dihydrouridine synthase A
VALRAIACHVLGLYHGQSGGRRFRQILSDAAKLKHAGPDLFIEALAAVEPVTAEPLLGA